MYHHWATSVGLSINPDKTDLVLFTKKYKVPRWDPPKLDSKRLTLKTHAKYLGVILDSKLTWKLNTDERVRRATNALYVSKKMLGNTWGLSPALMNWIYTSMYGVIVWWPAVGKLRT